MAHPSSNLKIQPWLLNLVQKQNFPDADIIFNEFATDPTIQTLYLSAWLEVRPVGDVLYTYNVSEHSCDH